MSSFHLHEDSRGGTWSTTDYVPYMTKKAKKATIDEINNPFIEGFFQPFQPFDSYTQTKKSRFNLTKKKKEEEECMYDAQGSIVCMVKSERGVYDESSTSPGGKNPGKEGRR